MRLWPFSRSAPVEEKALPSGTSVPEDWMHELFGGSPATAYAIAGARALTVPPVASAVTLISGSIASLDIHIQRRNGDVWENDSDHPVAELLADQPNDWTSTFALIRDLVSTALCYNEGALAWVNKREGRIVEIVRYEPGSYTIDYSTDGRQEPSYRIGNRPVSSDDVIHLRSAFSRCPLSLASEVIGVAKALESHAGNLFANAAKPGGVITTPKAIGDEGVRRMLAGWRAAHQGAAQTGKTAVLFDGASWSQMTLNSVDAQFLETWRHLILEIARVFRVPPGMIYDFERQTWSNMEAAQKEWLAGLEFWMRPLEAAMRRALFTADERPDWRIRFDRDDFSSVDLTARATAINSLVASRVLNPNEGRSWLDLSPYAGGDEFINPNITAPGASDAA